MIDRSLDLSEQEFSSDRAACRDALQARVEPVSSGASFSAARVKAVQHRFDHGRSISRISRCNIGESPRFPSGFPLRDNPSWSWIWQQPVESIAASEATETKPRGRQKKKVRPYSKGLHDIGRGHYVYLQPDGAWGLSNAGLVTDAGQSLLVDTLFDLRLTSEMLAAMRRATPAADTIGVLVNSHANGDHTFGNQLVEGARIIASRRCAEEMTDAGPQGLAELLHQARSGELGHAGAYVEQIFGRFDFAGVDRYVLPTEIFSGSLELLVGSKSVRLTEVGPAHTGGDIIVHVPADNVVYAADILFIDAHPIVWSGPVENWIRAIDLILSLKPEVIVPGHGPIPTYEQVIALKGYWEWLLRECKSRFEANLPAFEAAHELARGPYPGWGEGERLIINVETIYRQLSGLAAEQTSRADRFRKLAEFKAAIQAGN